MRMMPRTDNAVGPLCTMNFSCWLLAARCRLAEARERVEVTHEGVAPDICRAGLRRLRDRVRGQPHEPWEMYLVLGVVVPIGTLRTVRVRTLLEGVRALGEANRDDRVA